MGDRPDNDSVVIHDPVTERWMLFRSPLRVHYACSGLEIPALLEDLQRQVDEERVYAAGFLAYEAGCGLDPAFHARQTDGFPLAWFGIYEQPQIISAPKALAGFSPNIAWQSELSLEEHEQALGKIRDYIRRGETYQVNYSFRMRGAFAADPWAYFATMVHAQGAHYAAFVNTQDWAICSASPELFFRREGKDLICRPMKGTTSRGLWPAQDRQQARLLQASEKNRAENVMIVDMTRNDLGRVARPGTVQVTDLCRLEQYPTLWQMTSTVKCVTDANLPEIIRALFPGASITGAPKIRTMEIIEELERSPRKIYTGALGYSAPGSLAQFNVAIRTALIDKRRQAAEYGVGGGIVWDSVPAAEYEECQTKARIITEAVPEFSLLETILWKPGEGLFLLKEHLRRLSASSDYFCWKVDIDKIERQLEALCARLSSRPHRIRVLLDKNGELLLDPRPCPGLPAPYRVAFASSPVNSKDLFLYHKTTHRRQYDQALATCPEFDDVLLWNERKELTESTIANLVVEKDGEWLTPALECGLLPGLYRDFLLKQKRVREGVIRLEDIARCQQIFLVNSVRGMWKPAICHEPPNVPGIFLK